MKSKWIPSKSISGDYFDTNDIKLIEDTFFLDDFYDEDDFEPSLLINYSTGEIALALQTIYDKPRQRGLSSLFGPPPTSESAYGIMNASSFLEMALACKQKWETNAKDFQPPFQAMNVNPKWMREVLKIKLRHENLISTFYCTICHKYGPIHKATDPVQKADNISALYVLTPAEDVFNPDYYGCESCFKTGVWDGLASLFG